MIERYSRPKMAAIWTEQGKLDRWLAVEVAVVQAWADAGRVPREDADKVKAARYNVDDVARYQAETHHDVTAFLRSVADSLGPESRWVHLLSGPPAAHNLAAPAAAPSQTSGTPSEIAELKASVADLQREMNELKARLEKICAELGIRG